MASFDVLIRKIRIESIKSDTFNLFLTCALIFLSFNFILSFFGIPYAVSLVPALIYFVKRAYSIIRKSDIKFLEENEEVKAVIESAKKNSKNGFMGESAFESLLKKAKTIFLMPVLLNKRVEQKIYAIVILAVITILIGSFNLYPTKITFRVSDVDLTQPSLILDVLQRVNIQKPEFASCYAELNYTKAEYGKASSELDDANAEVLRLDTDLKRKSENLVTAYSDIVDCSKKLNESIPYKKKYEDTKTKLGDCEDESDQLSTEKNSLLTEKGVYVQENSDLRLQLDKLRTDLSICKSSLTP